MKRARQVAFEILIKIYKNNSYSNIEIDSKLNNCKLDVKDKALTTAIVYGVLERQITLDYILSLYLKKPLKRLKPEVLIALRIGAYQLLFLDKIPNSAAINESVNLTKNNGCAFASGFVNAVLRKVSKSGLILPNYDDNKLHFYSIKYSCPEQLVDLWINAYGEENAKQIMKASIGVPPTVIRVNTLKTTTEKLVDIFNEQGIESKVSSNIENALILKKCGAVEILKAYKDGLFHVQDTASQLCCKALGAKQGETVLDMCAAPGGKSFTIAQHMNNCGSLYSYDLYKSRINLISNGAKRLGISIIKSDVLDASTFNKNIGLADKVLCDVPCSGLGIIRRKPEIRYKSIKNIDNLPSIQYDILHTASKYVKLGGRIVYSTCSLNPQENNEVCDRFIKEHKQFKVLKPLQSVKSYDENSNYLTLMPHINNSDGFFIAAFVRTE